MTVKKKKSKQEVPNSAITDKKGKLSERMMALSFQLDPCKDQCHEPNSTDVYFHQAPPDSPPYTLAGLATAHRQTVCVWDPLRM